MYLERHKNWDGEWESPIIFRLYINPLLVQCLTINELHQHYCDLIIAQLKDPNFKLPKILMPKHFKKIFMKSLMILEQKKCLLLLKNKHYQSKISIMTFNLMFKASTSNSTFCQEIHGKCIEMHFLWQILASFKLNQLAINCYN